MRKEDGESGMGLARRVQGTNWEFEDGSSGVKRVKDFVCLCSLCFFFFFFGVCAHGPAGV